MANNIPGERKIRRISQSASYPCSSLSYAYTYISDKNLIKAGFRYQRQIYIIELS